MADLKKGGKKKAKTKRRRDRNPCDAAERPEPEAKGKSGAAAVLCCPADCRVGVAEVSQSPHALGLLGVVGGRRGAQLGPAGLSPTATCCAGNGCQAARTPLLCRHTAEKRAATGGAGTGKNHRRRTAGSYAAFSLRQQRGTRQPSLLPPDAESSPDAIGHCCVVRSAALLERVQPPHAGRRAPGGARSRAGCCGSRPIRPTSPRRLGKQKAALGKKTVTSTRWNGEAAF